MPTTLMSFDEQQKSVEGVKLGRKLKGNQAEHLWV
jgi:hypothetical protein